jgi:FtsH-binding integral membrane protein
MSLCDPIDECITKNPKQAMCLWYTFIVTLFVFLLVGLYIFFPEQKSIAGAVLLLIGAIGLMFVVTIYIFHCILGSRPLLPC